MLVFFTVADMSELFTPPHPHHEHLEPPTVASWPEQHAEESQLLALARRTANVAIPANYLPPQEYISELEQRYGVDDTRARLGDAYPQLSPEQDAAVVVRFANI